MAAAADPPGSRLGRFVATSAGGETVRAFLPPPLAPSPPLDMLVLLDVLQRSPFATSGQLVQRTGLTAPTVNAALAALVRLGIVEETTGRKRGRVFGYRTYLAILGEGTDPLPASP
ncbi:MAG: MarR family transcriptional regulator [Dongiaceae bacterium]